MKYFQLELYKNMQANEKLVNSIIRKFSIMKTKPETFIENACDESGKFRVEML